MSLMLKRRCVARDAAGGWWSVARRVKDDEAAYLPAMPLTSRSSTLLARFSPCRVRGAHSPYRPEFCRQRASSSGTR
jgi:hypothetical protein